MSHKETMLENTEMIENGKTMTDLNGIIEMMRENQINNNLIDKVSGSFSYNFVKLRYYRQFSLSLEKLLYFHEDSKIYV